MMHNPLGQIEDLENRVWDTNLWRQTRWGAWGISLMKIFKIEMDFPHSGAKSACYNVSLKSKSPRHKGIEWVWYTLPLLYFLTSAEHCFGNMAEKRSSFGVVARQVMMTGIECMNVYIFFGGKVFLNEDLNCGNPTEITETSKNVNLQWN